MKRILIPTDLTVPSLNTLKFALAKIQGEKVQVVLMYSEYLSYSIMDLLFSLNQMHLENRLNAEYKEALELIKSRYEQMIDRIFFRYFRGNNVQSFKNHIEAWKIDEIFIPGNYHFKTEALGFDPMKIIKRSKLTLTIIHWESDKNNIGTEGLVQIFNE